MKPTIGSVSSGTMLPEDLIPCFLSLLDDLKEERSLGDDGPAFKDDFGRIDDVLAAIEQRASNGGYYGSEDAQEDLSRLFDELEQFCPPFCYFGAHEGDGADYGFWPALESMDDSVHDETLLKVSDTSEVPEHVLHVDDHGNATLYRVELVEEWGIV